MGISPDILQPRKQLLFIFKLLYIIYIRAKLAHSTVAPQRLSADVFHSYVHAVKETNYPLKITSKSL